jgi:hypothetical protein
MGIDGVFSDFPDKVVAARILFKILEEPEFARCFTGSEKESFRRFTNDDCFDAK